MLPFCVTIPATVPQRSEIPEGLINYPVYYPAIELRDIKHKTQIKSSVPQNVRVYVRRVCSISKRIYRIIYWIYWEVTFICHNINLNAEHLPKQFVESLRYKPEGSGFDYRFCHWNFSLIYSSLAALWPTGHSASNKNESPPLWRCGPKRAMASSFLRFLDHTKRRTTFGRTPLDEWSACRRDLYLTTHNNYNRQTSMPPVGFEPTTSVGERPQTYALDRAATGTGNRNE